MKGNHTSSDYEKVDWLLKHRELWADIVPDGSRWPNVEEMQKLKAMVPHVKAAKLYAQSTFYKDIVISLYRHIHTARRIAAQKTTEEKHGS